MQSAVAWAERRKLCRGSRLERQGEAPYGMWRIVRRATNSP